MKGLYAEPPGVDFSRQVVLGLRRRLDGQPPEAMARVTLLTNTTRMARRIEMAFLDTGAALLPRVGLVSDISALLPVTESLPDAASPLALRLDLTRLVRQLLETCGDLAPPEAAYDLADSLGDLLEEMREEGLPPEALDGIDVGDLAAYWQQSLAFLRIATGWQARAGGTNQAGRQAAALDSLLTRWAAAPPTDPVVIAGSTGSRGATRALIAAVLALPRGAVILPGLDRDMPDAAWAALTEADGPGAQDHPQYRLAKLLQTHGRGRDDTPRWGPDAPASPARNRLISLALRPAPATDAWLDEGPALTDLPEACAGITLLDAPSPTAEAAAIATGLRAALEEGRRAALITPDRTLSRQVAAQLDRWGIRPDDSAGRPLIQSAPGRVLMHLAQLRARPLEAEGLMILLKHPITHSTDERPAHLRRTRHLELDLIRAKPLAFPTREAIRDWAEATGTADAWIDWLGDTLALLSTQPARAPLADHVAAHLDLAQTLAAGPDPQASTGLLWDGPAGREALRVMHELAQVAPEADPTPITALDYARILQSLLQAEEVRDPFSPHPDVMIWGALEARVRVADLVILGGLTEGTWPDQPKPDPWLNRQMRAQIGLRLPDRQIGLSAHDFQLAAAGPEVWLSHATRDAETETVPSRWLNRLTGLLGGLGDPGRAALVGMRDRGDRWLALADRLDRPDGRHPAVRAPRPAPKPPAEARPKRLSVTQVETLIRDPYAIYARHILGLVPLPPLRQGPDARLRGSVIHDAMERFVRDTVHGLPDDAAPRLMAAVRAELADQAPWPAHRRLWLGKFARIAPDLLAAETRRRAEGRPVLTEDKGEMAFADPAFTLSAKADRMDDRGGAVAIYDYKTGQAPSDKQQKEYAKQLLLEAVMVEAGAFPNLTNTDVSEVAYLQIGSQYKESRVPIDPALLAETRQQFVDLIRRYADGQPYIARLAPDLLTFASDYDAVARRGEWDDTQPATVIPVGP
ncbi:MAG: double-strand break repair protein AddB [Pseudomonadota bacterium]